MMRNLESQVMLRIIDTRWMAHLAEMDYLKTGIGLRAFAQRDPLVEYKNEAYAAFQRLTASMYEDYLRTLLRLQIAVKQEPIPEERNPLEGRLSYSKPEDALTESEYQGGAAPRRRPAQAARGAQARRAETHDVCQGQERPLRERRPQRPLPLWQRQEIQEVPWHVPGLALPLYRAHLL